jgi:hypothetical protein
MIITKDNIDQFIGGPIMHCYCKGITSIEYIPEGIIELYCHDNQLTSLPDLPEGLLDLDCSNNLLTQLPKLPQSLMVMDCEYNRLSDYPKYTTDEYWWKKHNRLINRSETIKKILNGNRI